MTDALEFHFQRFAEFVALGIEAASIIIVAVGAIEAAATFARHALDRAAKLDRRGIWLRFATWILLSLEFTLGADVIRTAIAPSWDDIGKLGAIAAIRTALSFFLARDMEEAARMRSSAVRSDS